MVNKLSRIDKHLKLNSAGRGHRWLRLCSSTQSLSAALAITIMIQLVQPLVVEAKILLVSKSGVDNSDCSVTACLTIQHTMLQAGSGDTVLVGAGNYTENIALTSGVYLVSNSWTTIEGQVRIVNSGPGTIIEGFTISKATSGGVFVVNSTVEIRRNLILDNKGTAVGGIYAQNSFVTIVNNLLYGNQASSRAGGAIAIEGGNYTIIKYHTCQ